MEGYLLADIRTLKLALLADTAQFQNGLNKAENDTKNFSSKVGSFVATASKAFLALGAAVGAAAIKMGVDAVQAAIEDEKAQATLTKTLQNTIKATDGQVKKVEEYIDATQRATGVADDKLRPSFDRLIRSTKDVTKAQQLQNLALDIAAGTGKDLQTVTEGLSKLYDGNFNALKKLGVPLDDTIVKNKDLDGAIKVLSQTFAGQADAAAATFEGRINRIKIAFGEAQEELGKTLLPILEKLADFAQRTLIPAFEDFIAGLTGSQPNSVKNATRDAKGRVEEFRDGLDSAAGNDASGAYGLGIAIKELGKSIAELNEVAFGVTGAESGLKKLLDLLTDITKGIENAINAYGRFRDSLIGGALLDLSAQVNPLAIGSRLIQGQPLVQAPRTANNININIGATSNQSVARTVVKSINSAVKTGVSNKLASNAVLR